VKREAALKSMQNHAFQEITQGQVVVLGQTLEDLDHAFLHPHSKLDPLNGSLLKRVFVYVHEASSTLLANKLHKYLYNLITI
jgi:hypothetical protein